MIRLLSSLIFLLPIAYDEITLTTDSDIIKIDGHTITALKSGETLVTATAGGGAKCSFTVVVEKYVVEIMIDSFPDKREYFLGESLDLSGLVMMAIYDNGDIEEITDYEVTGFDNTKTGRQVLTVSYGEFEDSFIVTVMEKPQYKKGDANLDGEINVLDASTIQKYVADLVTLNDDALLVADANSDGEVNVLDATRIQRFLAELIPQL